MAIFPGTSITPSGGYTIDQSLRFNDDDSAYLSRTPASAGNRKTWTWSGWVKRGNLGIWTNIFGAGADGNNKTRLKFEDNTGVLFFDNETSGTSNQRFYTTQVFRDTSAWYHLIVAADTTQATSTERLKIYVNGEQITAFTTSNYPSLNLEYNLNNNVAHYYGQDYTGAGGYFDGYLAEVNFIDGQALDPSYFGEADETYGHWKPIAYTGTYGTNGFYLDFSNSGSIGEDQAGSNDWTANNLAATDVVLDSPTNNFATLNPVYTYGANVTLSEGNLGIADKNNNWSSVFATMTKPSGKLYVESCHIANAAGAFFGIATDSNVSGTGFSDGNYIGKYSNDFGFRINDYGSGSSNNEGYSTNASFTSLGTAQPAVGNIYQLAVDFDNGKVYWGKNNTWYNSANPSAGTGGISISTSDLYHVGMTAQGTVLQQVLNFGQDSSFAGNKTAQNNTDDNGVGDFYYAPPSGFLALCTANLPDPAVVPGENFNTVLYTGNGSTNAISGVGFQPDWVWGKRRDSTGNNWVFDAVRAAGNQLVTNNTNAEVTGSTEFASFDSDGFTVTSTAGSFNASGGSYVAWNWKADNTSGSSNTDGSITSTVAANPDAGFSIVSYTGNASAGATVGHGLSQAPDMIILKDRSGATNWSVYHASNTSAPETDALALNTTDATSDYLWWNDTAPTSSVFSLGAISNTNASGNNFIAYCFHSVDGFSKFGSYTGNGSTDGPMVYTGFRPAFVMVKRTDGVPDDWYIRDSVREPENPTDATIYADLSYAEDTSGGAAYYVDFLSNGFKLKGSGGGFNASGGTYIYMAFAEFPTKFANAR
jgi:hypothetical protein